MWQGSLDLRGQPAQLEREILSLRLTESLCQRVKSGDRTEHLTFSDLHMHTQNSFKEIIFIVLGYFSSLGSYVAFTAASESVYFFKLLFLTTVKRKMPH